MKPHYQMYKSFAEQRTSHIEHRLFQRGLLLNQYRPRFFAQTTLQDEIRYALRLLSLKRSPLLIKRRRPAF